MLKKGKTMKNIASNVRSAIYVTSVFVNAMVAFLVAANVELNVWALAVLAGLNAVVAVVARANVTPDHKG